MSVVKKIYVLLVCLLIINIVDGQTNPQAPANNDTLEVKSKSVVKKDNRPRTAAIMSAIVPGLGQAYNGKYWKIPIIYSAMGSLTYLAFFNHTQYKIYLEAYANKDIKPPYTFPEYYQGLLDRPDTELLYYRNAYRRSRDLDFIGLAALYLANIIDATVDAHLRDYDVDDDFTFVVSPSVSLAHRTPTPVVALRFRF